eukprot:2137995-Lingulodinium_polyedra.AAC.1
MPGAAGGAWAGPVQTDQTAQRGEPLAAAATARLADQKPALVTDKRCARDGALRTAAKNNPNDWRHGN